jgi:hypothetical protein
MSFTINKGKKINGRKINGRKMMVNALTKGITS